MIKKLIFIVMLLISIAGLFSIFVRPQLDINNEQRNYADLEGVKDIALWFQSKNGYLPTKSEMYKLLDQLSVKNFWGHKYVYEMLKTESNDVIIIRDTGKDGLVGGFGKNRDQVLVYKNITSV